MVVIGNEILTGKVIDTNSPFLCRELAFLGVDLRRITTIGDDFEEIGRVARYFSEHFDWVFTSGGVGPTHDDITIPAIAAGFGVRAVPHPQLVEAIRRHYGERCTEAHLLMALVPEGAELIDIPGRSHPQVLFRNVFIMPGVPQLFQIRVSGVKGRLGGAPLILREIFLQADEGTIAATLKAVDDAFPDVLIGSYPNFFRAEYSVKVTVESRSEPPVQAAFADLFARLQNLGVTIVRVS